MKERFATVLCLFLELNSVRSKDSGTNFSCPMKVNETVKMDCENGICCSLSASDKNFILEYHNSIRNRMAGGELVDLPSVPNMLQMVWDDEINNCIRGELTKCSIKGPKTRPDDVAINTARAKFTLMNQASLAQPQKQLIWQVILDYWLFNGLKCLPSVWRNVTQDFAESDASSLLTPSIRSLGCDMTEQFNGSTYTFVLQCIYFPVDTWSLIGLPYYVQGAPRSSCPPGTGGNSTAKTGNKYPNLCDS